MSGYKRLNVIAKVKDQDQTLAYNPIIFQVQRSPRTPRVFVGILIALIIVLGLAALYYCRRYKKVQERLEYEMSDARNLAHVSTEVEVPAAKAETYTHLRVNSEN